MSDSLQTAILSIVRGGLFVLATRAHQASNTPPAHTPRNATPVTGEQQPLVGVDDSKKRMSEENIESAMPQEQQSCASKPVWHDSTALLKVLLSTIPVVHFFLWTVTLTELVTRLLSLSPSTSLSSLLLPYLLPSSGSTQQVLTTAPSIHSSISVLSVVLGTYLRLECFAALGKLFTFTHTTLVDHRLVTWGPYAYARHPSYTGMAMVYGGMVGLLGSQGGWLSTIGSWTWSLSDCDQHNTGERGVYATILVLVMRFAFILYLVWTICVISMLTSRAPKEDETLRQKFGREWEEYAKVVRWRFVPYLL